MPDCHDGTIALGAVGGRTTPIAVSGGPTMPTTAPGYLGTDLSGSHPISFVYDNALAVAHNAGGGMPLILPSTRTTRQSSWTRRRRCNAPLAMIRTTTAITGPARCRIFM